jgi:hypothetical protein
MVRKQIYISPHQEKLLKRMSKESGLSQAEIIRHGIDFYLQVGLSAVPDQGAWEEAKAFINRLIKQGPVKGKRRWRREEIYKR